MLDYLQYQVKRIYFENDQVLELEALYPDDGTLTEQYLCLVPDPKQECVFCIQLRTFKDLEFGEAGSKPYLLYNAEENVFSITIPKFKYLINEDIEKAVKYILREYFWICLKFKIKKEN
jgi:hypothetical protein